MKKMSKAMAFIILFGVVSLFSDMTHEAASSIRGVYFSLLGASASFIGFISGFGEMIGYSLRYFFGKLTDKTKQYWLLTIIGYILDIVCVPLLGLVGENGWILASILLVLQRIGKAIKKPAKNTIMSFAASSEGVGKSFGLQELLDQIGAFLGPIILYVVMLFKKGEIFSVYSFCFLVLAIPGAITLILLFITKRLFPNPEKFEVEPKEESEFKFNKKFMFYIIGISLFAFGFVDYSLLVYHVSNKFINISSSVMETKSIINSGNIPLLYSFAMIVDAFSAMFFGYLYDKKGVKSLIISTLISSLFVIFVFLADSVWMVILGVCLWGVGMGAQESILKAAVTSFVSKNNRATGYGIFEFSFGIFWFLGSWFLGYLYDINIIYMVIVSLLAQLLSIPFYILVDKKR